MPNLSVDICERDLNIVLETLNNSEELKLFISNPLIPNDTKKTILNQIFTNDLNSISLNFLMVLVDRGRISIIKDVIDKYLELVTENISQQLLSYILLQYKIKFINF